ncbi:outer membrane beta-barrel family protein [Dyadobacter sp. CY323]|uniref:outer membrane beta-barrel family protein n=1 Tax=Dyadobacter sp. CY323 TaxID=2907302 RepID=UPI001F17CBE6|nr:outer membrane beta-barrel family protein [Dyadobacter sp. CY323]MCE6989663.1 TonB-dependent receptor family protein [Dyadobacter sp. CY323]
MFKFLFALTLSPAIGICSLFAQTSIKGFVSDSASDTSISFANVSLHVAEGNAIRMTSLADSAGYFEFAGVADGSYLLRISSLGYLDYSKKLYATGAQPNVELGRIALQPDVTMLNAVTVKGEKPAVQFHSDRTVLNIAGNRFFKSSANLMDILRKAPGVSVNPDGAILLAGRNAPVLFINGKPMPMSADEMLVYLNGLNPESIESIEIITNPSSKYDGQFRGVIDVRLKSDLTSGWKGSLNSSLRRNVYSSTDNNLSLFYRTKGHTYSVRAAHVLGNDYYQYNAFQRLASKNYMITRTVTKTSNNNPTIQATADLSLKKNRHLELSLKAYQANRNLLTNNTLTFKDSLRNNVVGINQTKNQATPKQRNYAANVGYDMDFKASKLSFFGSLTHISNRQQEDIRIRDELKEMLRSYWKTKLHNQVQIRTIQSDYVKTLKNGRLESGAKYSFITTNNDLRYDTLAKDKRFTADAGRSNKFLYYEYITAGYVSYDFKLNKYSFNASLRAEHSRTVANAVTQGGVQKRDYTNWLPGATISYAFDKLDQISLSFTRRITRPDFDQLNPFRFYLSPLNYRVGNPYLRPSVVSSLQLRLQVRDFSATVVAGREKDLMARYPEYNRVTNELLYLGMNVPFSDFASLESSYTFAITNWWKTMHSAGIYYHKQQMPYLGKTYAIGVFDYSVNGSQTFSLPKGITADLTYRYKSKSGSSLYRIKSFGSVDIGAQKSWLDGKLSTKLNFYDLFYTHHLTLVFREKAIMDNQLSHRFRTRRAVLALIYNLGGATYQAKRARTSEEEKRAGS